jgi:rRNA processing protein Gar1
MSDKAEAMTVELVIEPVAPYTVADVETDLADDIHQAAAEEKMTDLVDSDRFSLRTERLLPPKEKLESIKLIVEVVIMAGQPLVGLFKAVFGYLKKKYGKVKVLKIKMDGKEITIPLEGDSVSIALEELGKYQK